MGLALAQAQSWLAKRADDLPAVDREFIDQSIKREAAERAQRDACGAARLRRLLVGLIGVLVGWHRRRASLTSR